MTTLRSALIRLAHVRADLRPHLLPLLKESKVTLRKQEITIPIATGATETLPAYTAGNWAVYRDLGGGRGWTVAHVPSGRAMRSGLRSKKMALAILEAVLDAVPALLNAKSVNEVMQHRDVIVSILTNPPTVQTKRRGPQTPKALPLDIEGILASEGLSSQGSRYGKAGNFWGIKGNGRMIAVGRRDILRNYMLVELLHGGPRIGSRWNMAESEYKSKMTEDRLRKWAKWAKGGHSSKELRQIARDEGMASGDMRR